MKSLLIISLLVLGARAGPAVTQCYTEQNLNGYYLNFDNYAPDLYTYNFDNVIDSVKQTGMWIYYENVDYNLSPGQVYFVHGIDITVNFPTGYSDITSSLRFVGSLEELNGDTITFYEGNSFTASEYFTLVDASSFGQMSGKISSVIVTGRNAWTIYSGEGFSGDRLCVYPNTDSDHLNDQYLDLGIFPNSQSLGVPDNSIRSVKKGCWTERVAKAPKLAMDGRQENGAWGRLV